MSEFNNRMGSQRRVLSIINSKTTTGEELAGLSGAAISRWASANQVSEHSEIVKILRHIASKLFFLATKSQEQITDEYKSLSAEVESLTTNLEAAMNGM